MLDLLVVHVTGADRPEVAPALVLADGEGDEDVPPAAGASDSEKARLRLRVLQVGQDRRAAGQGSLDLGD
jgi:hypothetical protein